MYCRRYVLCYEEAAQLLAKLRFRNEAFDAFLRVRSNDRPCLVLYLNSLRTDSLALDIDESRPSFALKLFQINEECESQTLDSFLIMPVQRVPRYVMLLTALQGFIDADEQPRAHQVRTLLVLS